MQDDKSEVVVTYATVSIIVTLCNTRAIRIFYEIMRQGAGGILKKHKYRIIMIIVVIVTMTFKEIAKRILNMF